MTGEASEHSIFVLAQVCYFDIFIANSLRLLQKNILTANKLLSISKYVLDYDERSSHTSVIREHYVFLLETLDVKFSGLVHELYSKHVLSPVERDDIIAEQTSFRANEKLLSVLSRKSPQQFQLFLDPLDNCGQQHVRNVIDDRRQGLSTRLFAACIVSINGKNRPIYNQV